MTCNKDRTISALLSHLDLNLLKALAMLLETKSVTLAAQRLGVSQPVVSRHLANLRQVFDDQLLIRTNRGMYLTARADELRSPLEEWLAATSAIFVRSSFAPAQMERRFKIASTDYGVARTIEPSLGRIAREAPLVSIDVFPFGEDMFKRLASGELDLVITGDAERREETHSRYLYSDLPVCLMRAGHPLATPGKQSLTIDEFLFWPHIGIRIGSRNFDPVAHHLGELASERRIIASLPYFQSAPGLLQQSDALLLLPRYLASFARTEEFMIMQAPPEIGCFDYWLLWHERSRRDPGLAWLADTMAMESGSIARSDGTHLSS